MKTKDQLRRENVSKLTDKECDEMSARELSEVSGISESAIRSRIKRGNTGRRLVRDLVLNSANVGNRRHKKGSHPWREWADN